jgi:hypothetical protein
MQAMGDKVQARARRTLAPIVPGGRGGRVGPSAEDAPPGSAIP